MEGRELPVGWVEVPIGDLCELRNGRAFKPAEWTDEGIPIVRIQNLNNWQAKFNHYQGEVDANHLLGGGELLFAWSGTPGTSFGAHIWAGGKAALNQHIFRVDFDEDSLQKGFFRYAINQKLNDLIDIAHGGVGLRHVTKGKFEQTEVFLPPLNEQRRLAAKLDTTLAAVDACRQRLDGVAAILKRFRQAVLSAATSGELTREWREELPLDHIWEDIPLGELILEGPKNGLYKPKSDYGQGTRILRIDNFYEGSVVDWSALKRLSLTDSEKLEFALTDGDIVVNRVNSIAYLGKTALIDNPSEGCVFESNMMRIRLRIDHAHPSYVNLYLCSPRGIHQLRSPAKHAVNQASINQQDVKSVRVPLPSIKEQHEIVRRVQEFFSHADQLETKLTAARRIVERLTPALLAKAFRGELVPQDPSDEPASVLLKRIRAARQADAAAGKSSGRGRKKAAALPDQLPLDAAPVPPDLLSGLLRECGALSERALLAASELDAGRFRRQLEHELKAGSIRDTNEEGKSLLEAVEAP